MYAAFRYYININLNAVELAEQLLVGVQIDVLQRL